jgi:O-acetyl-ADP-ribose deacetylase (regulator of RNase III)
VITYVATDLFTSPAQTLVNTVNTAGVMGKGLAKTFKGIYPEMFADYKRRCERGELVAGRLLLYRTPHKWVLNFPTKRHWRQPSRLEDIEAGLQIFGATYTEQGITSVAYPQLGCGNGGLDWEDQVRPLMERYLGCLPIDVYIHIAHEASAGADDVELERTAAWLRDEPRLLSYQAVWSDLKIAVQAGQAGQAAEWSVHGMPRALHLDEALRTRVIDRDDLRDLWRRLRSFGYLIPEDVALVELPPQPVLDLFASLPYVDYARVVPMPQLVEYHERSTSALLNAPEARGVRIVPPMFGERLVAPPFMEIGDEDAWDANRTTRQLALFSAR